MDYKDFTDEQLDESRRAILTEQERRVNLEQIPNSIAELSIKYKNEGGSYENLEKAIQSEEEQENE